MPSVLTRYGLQHDASSPRLQLPALLFVTSVITYLGTPVQHSLLTSAVAWVAICIYTTLKSGSRSSGLLAAVPAQRLANAAGGLLALGQVCERAVEGRGIWWAHGLLPLVIYCFLKSHLIGNDVSTPSAPESPPASPAKPRTLQLPQSGSKTTLVVLTGSAVTATFTATGTNASIALGLSYAVIEALAFLLLEKAAHEAQSDRQNGGSMIYSTNGLLSHSVKPSGFGPESRMAVLRDVSMAAAAATTLATFTFESFKFGGLAYWGILGQVMGERWLMGQGILTVVFAILTAFTHAIMHATLVITVQRHGTFLTSFVPLSAAIFSQLLASFSISRLWFAALCAVSAYFYLDEQDTSSGGQRKRMRFRRLLTLITIISFGALTVLYLRDPYHRFRQPEYNYDDYTEGIPTIPPPAPLAPKKFENTRVHPIDQLVRDAEASWLSVLQKQSRTLEAAVAEYKRRYGIPPPPNFHKWYEFAKRKNVQLIDEYDTIYHSLLPFWGLPPATIRSRAREVIGHADNMLMGLALRDGQARGVIGGQDWLQQAAVGMIQEFVQYLPDMDLAFNTHDEPRVVVPFGDLSRLVQIGLKENMPPALKNMAPRNSFSARPKDVNSGKRFGETKTTRFNRYAHQHVWIPSRLSCSPDSPARALDEALAADNLTAYAISELGFVYNHTAFSDICNSPSFGTSHGFFDRPNAYNVVHDLFPIFSQSKISSFQDILYPSPWYWYGKVGYQETQDLDWSKKMSSLLWRGSTTGGFSREGGWRRQHRQHIVQKVNALDNAKILQDVHQASSDGDAKPEYKMKEVPRQDYKDVIDVHFSGVGQCDPGDCDAQREFFTVVDSINQQDHWKWRFLLDMDGNAFSGRFYAFLKSKSLVFKMAVFREWHEEWIKPWVHYIPLSLRGEEVLESVRYFIGEDEGKKEAIRLAEASRQWAKTALRNEDFEVWLFRLLLEYGRLVDDNRAEIGYSAS